MNFGAKMAAVLMTSSNGPGKTAFGGDDSIFVVARNVKNRVRVTSALTQNNSKNLND